MLPLTLMLPTKSILTGAKTVGPSLSEEKKSSLCCKAFSISDTTCRERVSKTGQAGNGPTVTAKEQVMASCKSLLMVDQKATRSFICRILYTNNPTIYT